MHPKLKCNKLNTEFQKNISDDYVTYDHIPDVIEDSTKG